VPSEATFSLAFDAFACDGRPQPIHDALIHTDPISLSDCDYDYEQDYGLGVGL
jgi:hypothetical protein